MTGFRFIDGPWENSREPTITRTDPDGGDPHILATLTRIHRPEALYEICALANAAAELLDVARDGLSAMRVRVAEILNSHCLIDDQGNPDRATLDADCEDEVGELEQQITRAVGALAYAEGRS